MADAPIPASQPTLAQLYGELLAIQHKHGKVRPGPKPEDWDIQTAHDLATIAGVLARITQLVEFL